MSRKIHNGRRRPQANFNAEKIEKELRIHQRQVVKTGCSPSHPKEVTFSTRLAANVAINSMTDYAKYLATSVSWCAGCRNFVLQTN